MTVDPKYLELMASYEQALDLLEYAVTSVQALVKAYESGLRPSDATLATLRAESALIEQGAANLRVIIAEAKARFRTPPA